MQLEKALLDVNKIEYKQAVKLCFLIAHSVNNLEKAVMSDKNKTRQLASAFKEALRELISTQER